MAETCCVRAPGVGSVPRNTKAALSLGSPGTLRQRCDPDVTCGHITAFPTESKPSHAALCCTSSSPGPLRTCPLPALITSSLTPAPHFLGTPALHPHAPHHVVLGGSPHPGPAQLCVSRVSFQAWLHVAMTRVDDRTHIPQLPWVLGPRRGGRAGSVVRACPAAYLQQRWESQDRKRWPGPCPWSALLSTERSSEAVVSGGLRGSQEAGTRLSSQKAAGRQAGQGRTCQVLLGTGLPHLSAAVCVEAGLSRELQRTRMASALSLSRSLVLCLECNSHT